MPEQTHTLYVSPASAPCRAVLLHAHLCERRPELEVIEVDLSEGDHKTPEFLRNNPLHCVPTLVTPWGPLWESRSIMRYLEALLPEPRLYPIAAYHRAVVDRLLDWDLGTLYRTISSIVYPKVFRDEDPSSDDLDKLNDATRFLDQKQLGDGRAFLTGAVPTIADISCAMTLSLLRLIGLEVDDVPRMTQWTERVALLDGFDQVDAPFQTWVDSLSSDAGESAPEAEKATEPSPEAPADAS